MYVRDCESEVGKENVCEDKDNHLSICFGPGPTRERYIEKKLHGNQ